jgi:hypothetical protein
MAKRRERNAEAGTAGSRLYLGPEQFDQNIALGAPGPGGRPERQQSGGLLRAEAGQNALLVLGTQGTAQQLYPPGLVVFIRD